MKWVGGKTQLLPELIKRVPPEINNYYEPFLGGGALFFKLLPKKACLLDINADLINLYQVIRDDLEELIADLRHHVYEKEYYYKMRGIDRTPQYLSLTDIQRASRFIYLNKTCYNGLYRVNSKGEFNVPFGRYTDPTILDENNLRACHHALQKTSIQTANFYAILETIRLNDFVYFDPPYVPLNTTSNFTGYTKSGFDKQMQYSLFELCCSLDQKDIRFMMSNSSAPLVLDLYSQFNVEFVYANRALNSDAAKRGKITEVIITNYQV